MGIALSDPTRTIAQPLEWLPAEPFSRLTERLQDLIQEREVSLILIGMPRNMDGSYGPAADKVREFADRLRAVISVPLDLEDERLTTVQADRALLEAGIRGGKRRNKVDQTAAALFLQSYLDRQG